MNRIADIDIPELSRELAELHAVRLAWLFGSHARGEARPDSDVDVAVLVDDEAVSDADARRATIWKLAGRLGRVVGSHRLDLVLLNRAPALLRHRVLRDGELLFERSPEERVRFVRRTIREFQDGHYRQEWFLRRRIERLRRGNEGTGEEGPTIGGSSDFLEKARSVARLFGEAGGVS